MLIIAMMRNIIIMITMSIRRNATMIMMCVDHRRDDEQCQKGVGAHIKEVAACAL